jgi:hypothetical protein
VPVEEYGMLRVCGFDVFIVFFACFMSVWLIFFCIIFNFSCVCGFYSEEREYLVGFLIVALVYNLFYSKMGSLVKGVFSEAWRISKLFYMGKFEN